MEEQGWKSLDTILKTEFTPEVLLNRPPRLKTGFARLDRMLGGGLSPGLIVLGGVPSLGKSTFSLQLAEQVIERDPRTAALYFSLEMPGDRIAAKSVARRFFQASGGAERLTADDLTNPESARRLPPETWERINQLRVGMGENQGRFLVKEETLSAGEIADQVAQFRENHPDLRPPLVIVDYLQILPPDDPKAGTGKQIVEDSLKELVRLAHGGVPVILISSLNRGSYVRPIQMDSFKESGGIEYSADVLLGLQFQACHKKENWDLNEEKRKSPRGVEISVLKQRYGSSGDAVSFRYYAECDCFVEAAGEEPDGGTAHRPAAPIRTEEALPANGGETSAKEPRKAGRGRKRRGTPQCVNNTKIANELRKGAQSGECVVFPKKQVVTVYALSAPLTARDYNVADVLYTLRHAKNETFTLARLLRELSGDPGQTLTKQMRGELLASLDRLRSTSVTIDCSAEMRVRGRIREDETMILAGPLLAVREEGGDTFRFDGEMPLYTYCEYTTQMITFPGDRLAVVSEGKKLTDTLENIDLKRFLIRRVEVLRRKEALGHAKDPARQMLSYISFQKGSGLLEELGLRREDYRSETAWANKLRRLRQTALQILDAFRETGYIAGVAERSTGAIQIEVSPDSSGGKTE